MTEEKLKKQQKILNYADKKIKNGEDISHRKINKDLNLSVKTYFKNIYEIYSKLKIIPPISKTRIKEKI